ncbi:MAG TPA: CCA tRNA nucleotidyltransferase [Candidatus Baltobacteraceae bacterium]|nr:CCA tRNA nucleotidyltransferase [Candidatus Baltobacteraceae bacterium]
MPAQKLNSHETATEIVKRLQANKFSAFWVGGCVRDFLLGREPQDFDIATDAKPDQVEKLFKRTIAVGKKFGVIVVVENKHQFQVATFRAEADYKDGRRPETIHFANAEADALRRDFTVNGLFYDPISKKTHDWVGGEKDLRARIIRTIGKPEERFAEDHLRLLRAVRFAAQLNFEIEPKTFAAIRTLAPKIKIISAERIRDELLKLFCPPHAARGLELLRQSHLLEHILPELAATVSCEQSPDYHPEGTVFEHIKLMLEKMPPDANELLPWTVLFHDIAKPVTAEKDLQTGSIHFYGHEKIGATMAEKILERLRFPRKQIEEIVACVLHHMQFKDVKQMRKATLRRLLLRETFPLELELHKLDCLGSHGDLELYDFLIEQAEEIQRKPEIKPPLLTGKDLMALGMKPGPAMGAMLNEIREKQLADELKNARQAKAWVKRTLAQ